MSSMKFVAERDLENPVVPGHEYLYKWIKPYIKTKSKILDIGCWTGPMEILLEKEDCEVTGTDIMDEPLKYDRKRFPKFKFVKAFVQEKLPFKKNEFDIILFFMVIEHIPINTEDQALTNINSVMKKGGSLFLSTMNNNLFSNILDPAYWLIGHRHYTENQLRKMLKKTGFEVKEIYYNAGYFTTIHIWMLYFFKHVLRRREPRGKFFDKLIATDYKNKGFAEIEIRAVKIKDFNS